MTAALEYIFKKHWYVIAATLIVLGLFKFWSIQDAGQGYTQFTFQKQWIQEMYDLNMEERKVYLDNLMEALHQIANQESGQHYDVNVDSINAGNVETAISEYWSLYAVHTNQQELYQLIEFAKNKEGVLPIGLPNHYLELQDFYAEMEEPRLIPEKSLKIYFHLQESNVIPLITFLVFAIYFSIHYESQVYKYTLTTPKGKLYNKQIKRILVALFLGILVFNELFDLSYSGIIFDSNLLKASIQSYSEFQSTQLHTSIGACLLYSFIAKIIGLLIICQFSDIIARITKNTKDTMVGGAFLFLFLFLFTQTLGTNDTIALIQVGMVNWETLIANIAIFLPIGCSYAAIGFLINLGILMGSLWFKNRT